MTIANMLNSSIKSVQVFTSGTAATYTTPAGITSILVELIGGGGGGGGMNSTAGTSSCGGGGGSGAYCKKLIINPAATYTYTVGAGGPGGTAGANDGEDGNDTTFSTLTAGGGKKGTKGTGTGGVNLGGIGGAGGTATGGNINISGADAYTGMNMQGLANGGKGGDSVFGGSGAYTWSAATLSAPGVNAAANTGSGGSGASGYVVNANQAGGNGAAGIIVVWEFS